MKDRIGPGADSAEDHRENAVDGFLCPLIEIAGAAERAVPIARDIMQAAFIAAHLERLNGRHAVDEERLIFRRHEPPHAGGSFREPPETWRAVRFFQRCRIDGDFSWNDCVRVLCTDGHGFGVGCGMGGGVSAKEVRIETKAQSEQEHCCERDTIHYAFPAGGRSPATNDAAQLAENIERQLAYSNSPLNQAASSRFGSTGYEIDIGRHHTNY